MEKLEENDSDCVDVTFVVDTLAIIHEPLRCQIQRSTKETMGLFVLLELFCQSEISKVNVSILVDKNVLWLQISVEDLFIMEELYRANQFCDDLDCFRLL